MLPSGEKGAPINKSKRKDVQVVSGIEEHFYILHTFLCTIINFKQLKLKKVDAF